MNKNSYVKCSLPNCDNKVGYHRIKANKRAEGYSIVWKNMCEKHRKGKGKTLVDRWKMQQGCCNSNGKYGLSCTSVISDSGQLQINHIDGNNSNRDDKNIEVICGNCHTLATKINKHHMPNRNDRHSKIANPDLFENI